jgi:hypothetical protein
MWPPSASNLTRSRRQLKLQKTESWPRWFSTWVVGVGLHRICVYGSSCSIATTAKRPRGTVWPIRCQAGKHPTTASTFSMPPPSSFASGPVGTTKSPIAARAPRMNEHSLLTEKWLEEIPSVSILSTHRTAPGSSRQASNSPAAWRRKWPEVLIL